MAERVADPGRSRLRVMQMFYTYDIEKGGGGLSRFAIELGRCLDPQRFETIFCSLGYGDSPAGQKWIAQLQAEGYQAFEATKWVLEQPYTSFVKAQKGLQARLAREPADVLHSHSEFTDINAMLLKALGQAPIIFRTVHYGFNFEWSRKPLRRALLTNFLFPIYFDQEVGINQFRTDRLNRRSVARLLNKSARRIYNAIPLEAFESLQVDVPEKKRGLGIPVEAQVVGAVGRLAEQKGYTYLLDAAKEVCAVSPQIYFLIAGDGPLAGELKAKAERIGLAGRVIFSGSRPDIPELLRCMDVFVSSSLWEGLPTVILEAMASGVPVVATDIPGTNELVKHGANGWLAPPRDGRKLAQMIIELLGSYERTNQFTQSAQETVKEFSIQHIARQYEQLYLKLINRKNRL